MKFLKTPLLYAAIAGAAALFVISTFGRSDRTAAPREPGSTPRVVIVELCTSEGCSSCPPADAFLKQLSKHQCVQGAQIVPHEVQVTSLDVISVQGELELWVAVTEKGIQTDVKAGENSGEPLRHAAVARSLRRIHTVRDLAGYHNQIQFALDAGWKKENLAVVVF